MDLHRFGLYSFCLLTIIIGTTSDQKSPHCTFPAQWQSTIFFDFVMLISAYQVSGQAYGSGTFYYDYPNQQMRLDLHGTEFSPDKKNFTVSFMWRFKEEASYYIDYDGKFCERSTGIDNVWKQWQGVPRNATSEYIGNFSASATLLERYSLITNDGDRDVLIDLDVLIGDSGVLCPPTHVMFQNLHDNPDEYILTMYQYEFMDLTPLDDPSVFIPPTNCSNNTLQNDPKQRFFAKQYPTLFMG